MHGSGTDGGCAPGAGDYETEETAPSADEATEVILRALSLGISFLNTSDLYGPFQNERRIGVPLAACHTRRVNLHVLYFR